MQVFSDTTEPVQRGHWSQAPWLLRPPQHQKAQWPKGLLAGLGDIGHGAWHNLPRDRILPPTIRAQLWNSQRLVAPSTKGGAVAVTPQRVPRHSVWL